MKYGKVMNQCFGNHQGIILKLLKGELLNCFQKSFFFFFRQRNLSSFKKSSKSGNQHGKKSLFHSSMIKEETQQIRKWKSFFSCLARNKQVLLGKYMAKLTIHESCKCFKAVYRKSEFIQENNLTYKANHLFPEIPSFKPGIHERITQGPAYRNSFKTVIVSRFIQSRREAKRENLPKIISGNHASKRGKTRKSYQAINVKSESFIG